jgi:hypothetical protein
VFEFGEVVEFFKSNEVPKCLNLREVVVKFFKSNEVPKCQPKVQKKAFEISQPRDSICKKLQPTSKILKPNDQSCANSSSGDGRCSMHLGKGVPPPLPPIQFELLIMGVCQN